MSMEWSQRPEELTERSYRKYTAEQKKVTVNGTEYTLQNVSPTWYFNHNDECGMTGGRGKTVNYVDSLIKNIVISPKEVNTQGISYSEEAEDISTPEKLMVRIESFLRG